MVSSSMAVSVTSFDAVGGSFSFETLVSIVTASADQRPVGSVPPSDDRSFRSPAPLLAVIVKLEGKVSPSARRTWSVPGVPWKFGSGTKRMSRSAGTTSALLALNPPTGTSIQPPLPSLTCQVPWSAV